MLERQPSRNARGTTTRSRTRSWSTRLLIEEMPSFSGSRRPSTPSWRGRSGASLICCRQRWPSTTAAKINVRLERYAELSGRGACLDVETRRRTRTMLDLLENRDPYQNRRRLRKEEILFAEKRKCHRLPSKFPKLRGENSRGGRRLRRDGSRRRPRPPRTPRKRTCWRSSSARS